MKIGIKPTEASDLFLAFDTDGSGGIDEKALFSQGLVAHRVALGTEFEPGWTKNSH